MGRGAGSGGAGSGAKTAEGKAEPEHSEDELLRRPNTKEMRNRPTAPTDRRTDERRWYNIRKMPYQRVLVAACGLRADLRAAMVGQFLL